jgi:23S rRNA pseudouridine1911/1915/1917 synthase
MLSLGSVWSGMINSTLEVAGGIRHAVCVSEEEAGARLDRYLTSALEELEVAPSRSRIRTLIEEGHVTAGPPGAERTIGELSYRVKPGETYTITLPTPSAATPQPEDIPLTIIHEDPHLLVVEKPAGLVVHPAPGSPNGTLVNALLAHCGPDFTGIGGELRPGIVHRLDKETSGLMVVAKTETALKNLQEQFAIHGRDGRLERAYTAFVWGKPHPSKGTINAPLARSRHNRLKITVTRTPEAQGAREAITHYKVTKSFGEPDPLVSEVICQLETGRTHQIRVHLTHAGHPILGDPVYGSAHKNRAVNLTDEGKTALEGLGRQALHAHLLGFEHPNSGEKLLFESPLPPEMANLRRSLEFL